MAAFDVALCPVQRQQDAASRASTGEHVGFDCLLLEQVFKRLARVARLSGGWGGGLLLYHHAHRVERAVIALILGRNSLGNRLCALEAAGRIEGGALLAGVQLETALRTHPRRIAGCLQHGAALGAARDGARTRHLDGPGTERRVALADRLFG